MVLRTIMLANIRLNMVAADTVGHLMVMEDLVVIMEDTVVMVILIKQEKA